MENKILKEDEWLIFKLKAEKPKTKVISVMSKFSDIELGEIKWHPAWRHYCYFPTIEEETIYSSGCLLSISGFVMQLNEEHRMGGEAKL